MAYAPAGSRRTRTTTPGPTNRAGSGPRNGRPGSKSLPAPAPRASTAFLAGLGIGLAVGAAAALLLAPQAGADLRRALRSRGSKARNKTTDAWEDLRLELARTARAIKRKRRDAAVQSAAVPKADG